MYVLVLTGSPHIHGATDLLAGEFIRGAEEAGHEVIRFDAAFMGIHPCLACDGCRESGICVQKDGMEKVLESLLDTDLVALVTPLYYYGITNSHIFFYDSPNGYAGLPYWYLEKDKIGTKELEWKVVGE